MYINTYISLQLIALIENITAVPDYSANPEGLPNLSLLIQTNHRQLKLTAPSMEKHEEWFEVYLYIVAYGLTINFFHITIISLFLT